MKDIETRNFVEIEKDGITIKFNEKREVENVFIYATYCSGKIEDLKKAHKKIHQAFEIIKNYTGKDVI